MMTGLIILSIFAVLMFFGLTSGYFKDLKMPVWVGFIAVLALAVGVVVPNIKIGSAFSMNIGGFLVPLIIGIVLMFLIGFNSDFARAAIATLAVASVAVSTRMLLLPTSSGYRILAAVIIGVIGGGVAYLICKNRLSSLAAAFGGVVLGDIVVSNLYYFVNKTATGVYMGVNGVFDTVIIAGAVTFLIAEIVMLTRKGITVTETNKSALTESSQDQIFPMNSNLIPPETDENFDDYFDDDIE